VLIESQLALELHFNRIEQELEGRTMSTPAYCFATLNLDMDEKPEEITIRCNGKITADSARMFQRDVCGYSLPVSRGKGVPVINRVILDLSHVTHIDNVGLEALLDVWTAAQRKSCSVEIVNRGPQALKRGSLLWLDRAFRWMLALFE
jgi:anti-anti-sigma regulatory factor